MHRFFYSSFLIDCQLALNETISVVTDRLLFAGTPVPLTPQQANNAGAESHSRNSHPRA